MNAIAHRTKAAFILVCILLVGLVFFVGEYFVNADEWFAISGHSHSYHDHTGRVCVTDRAGELLMEMDEALNYADSEDLRASMIHWLGDREGNIYAPLISNYSDAFIGYDLIDGIYAYQDVGGQMYLTLSAEIQKTALEAMGDYRGTVAVYNYKTGEILCAVSTPAYDPDNVPAISSNAVGAYDGAYYNRFTQLSYIPGSIFEVVTTAAALEEIKGIEERVFRCDGSYVVDGEKLSCEVSHGNQTLSEVMLNSCNCAYAQIALELGADGLKKYVDKYEIIDGLHFDGILTNNGRFNLENATDLEIVQSAIGQHNDLINPCRLMTLMGTIAGDGNAAEPYLVKKVTAGGGISYKANTEITGRCMSIGTAQILQEYMRGNIVNCYGDEAFSGLNVCAKFGVAETEDKIGSNTIFAGFCMSDDYPFAFVMLAEIVSEDHNACVPIVSRVLQACKDVLDEE